MSRKGNCLDNAPMESFFHTFKVERVHHRVYANRAEARRDLFTYIEGFCNSRRLHSALALQLRFWLCSASAARDGIEVVVTGVSVETTLDLWTSSL